MWSRARASTRRQLGRVGSAERTDQGFGLVETVVAFTLLAIVVVPVTRIIIGTSTASNGYHLRVEASDLATQALAQVAYEASTGNQWAQGSVTSTQQAGSDTFNVAVDVEPVNATTICSAGGSPQAWSAQATVTWGGASAGQDQAAGNDVVQSTLIPPPQSEASDSSAAEIAIPVYVATSPTTLETAAPVTITVTGSCSGSCGSSPPAGSNLATSESQSTGTSGCAVFTGLYAGSGWSYSAQITASDGYVNQQEQSSDAGATQAVLASTIAVSPGVVAVPSAGFYLAPGTLVSVNFAAKSFAGVVSAASPATYLPVTVEPASGPCAVGCTLGNTLNNGNTQAFSTGQQMGLYPVPVASGANYLVWAGGVSSSPLLAANGANGTATPLATASQNTVTLPVYPLALTVTKSTSLGAAALSAAAVGSTQPISLNVVVVGANPTSGVSTTALPLGQYQVTSTSSMAASLYVWITTAGVCNSTHAMTSCPSSSASTAAIGPVALS